MYPPPSVSPHMLFIIFTSSICTVRYGDRIHVVRTRSSIHKDIAVRFICASFHQVERAPRPNLSFPSFFISFYHAATSSMYIRGTRRLEEVPSGGVHNAVCLLDRFFFFFSLSAVWCENNLGYISITWHLAVFLVSVMLPCHPQGFKDGRARPSIFQEVWGVVQLSLEKEKSLLI